MTLLHIIQGIAYTYMIFIICICIKCSFKWTWKERIVMLILLSLAGWSIIHTINHPDMNDEPSGYWEHVF